MSSTGTAPMEQITAEDHGAYIIITAGMLISWTILVFLMRMYIRFRINGKSAGYFGHDDTAFTLGAVIAIVQTGVTLAAVKNGLGRSASILTPYQIEQSLQ
ncbi:hypothetical protein MMC30_001494, partial [Trapelia coarctata]|nr:hypothetical protein [Trapelia coarctata]